jgi:2-polyprenyl-3-methyl-5-hydroxy-6-metoxy-1,4-benzoquinol methylase
MPGAPDVASSFAKPTGRLLRTPNEHNLRELFAALLEKCNSLTPKAVKRVLPAPLLRALKQLVPGRPPPSVTIVRDLAGLDRKLLELEAAAAQSDDALRAAFLGFSMDFSRDLPPDPYSEAYRQRQFELYAHLAGKPYSTANESSQIDVAAGATRPFPFATGSCRTVGNQLIAIGFLIKVMALASGARILEFGPGWGNTTEFLARMGFAVTAVDIEMNFIELIRERARRNELAIELVHGDFSHIEIVTERYDAILFFECFHHASDHLKLMQGFERALKPDGKVFFAAEPISDTFALPWGLRMDGESLWAVRKFGWLELGFQESYMRETLLRLGWSLQKQVCDETPWGTVFVASRTPPNP